MRIYNTMVTTMDLYILALVDIIAEAVSIFFKSYYFFSFPYGIVIKIFFFSSTKMYSNLEQVRKLKEACSGLTRKLLGLNVSAEQI